MPKRTTHASADVRGAKRRRTSYKRKTVPYLRNTTDTGGLSNKAIVKLRYVDNRILSSTSIALGRHVYSCNSCFDPDYTGVGHQPLGYDEWSTLYTYYKVLGAKITVSCVNGTGEPQLVHIGRFDDPAPAGGMSALQEQAHGSWVHLAGSLGGQQNMKLISTYSAKKQFPNLDSDAVLRPNTGANPDEQMYWVVSSQRTDAAGNADVAISVNIEYIVEFSVPKILTQS